MECYICDICIEQFDVGERLPKVLACGHTLCLSCVRRLRDRRCPTCRREFDSPPEALPNTFALLPFLQGPRLDRAPAARPRCWCSDCRAADSPQCWDAGHEVQPAERALRRRLQGVGAQVVGLLEALQAQCQDEQALQALTLLDAESWDLTLRSEERLLRGTVGNTGNPLIKALWLVLACKAELTEDTNLGAIPPALQEASGPSPSHRDPRAPQASSTPMSRPQLPLAEASQPRQTAPSTSRQHPRELDVTDCGDVNVDEILAQASGVRRLMGVWCPRGPWTLDLLMSAAPTVEQLSLINPREAHLRAAHHAMPRLKSLYVSCTDAGLSRCLELPALPPGRGGGLQWLGVDRLPRATLESVLHAHGRTLVVLELFVGTAGPMEWPASCGDLHDLLGRCGLRALRRLVPAAYLSL